jgi:hypothetical protein
MSGYVLEIGADGPNGRTCVGEVGPFSSPLVAEAWFAQNQGKTVREVFEMPMTFEWSEAEHLQDEVIKGWTMVFDDDDQSTFHSESKS